MAATTNTASETLEVRRTFNAPRQRVYDAWTKAEEVKKWAGPGKMDAIVSEADVRARADEHSARQSGRVA